MRRPRVSRALAGTLAGILILAGGCTDLGPTGVHLSGVEASNSLGRGHAPSPAANPPEHARAEAESPHPLVGTTASLLTYGNSGKPATYAAIIGPSGGTLEFEIGSISFPAGALTRPTRITASIDGETASATFGPHGTVFPVGREPILTFRFDGLEIAPEDLQIQYLREGLIAEVLETWTDLSQLTASAEIFHFSPYILGASRMSVR